MSAPGGLAAARIGEGDFDVSGNRPARHTTPDEVT